MKTNNYDDILRLVRRRPIAPVDPLVIHKSHKRAKPPRLSFILLDWNCRERFNTLDWLNQQDVPRDDYELIWVELYDRLMPEVMEKADTVITLNQRGVYHKHRGYNVGLLHAQGELICVCDSDAVFPKDFIRSVFRSFHPQQDNEAIPLVLMHHELRTSLLYPEHLDDAENLKNREKWGWWPVVPNAGACMTVRKKDAIRFGGFDEDKSYRGYLCGPYDLGWRLVNAGWPEIWHDETVVLWHFAHPDPVGANGFGPRLKLLLENTHPHVDMHALTAVDAFSSGRFLPRQENPEIFVQRMADRRIGTAFEEKYANMTGVEGFTPTLTQRMRISMLLDIVRTVAVFNVMATLRRMLRRILGEARYLRCRRFYFDHLSKNGDPSEGPRLIGEYKGYNLLRVKGAVFGFPQILGSIDPNNDEQLKHPAIVRTSSVRRTKRSIDRDAPASWVTVHVGRQGGHNICQFRNRYYAVPENLGNLQLHVDDSRYRPEITSSDTLEQLLAELEKKQTRKVAAQ